MPFDDIILGGLLGKGRCAVCNACSSSAQLARHRLRQHGNVSNAIVTKVSSQSPAGVGASHLRRFIVTTGVYTLCLPCSFGNVYFGVWQKSSDCEVDVAVKASSTSGLLRTCKSSMGILQSVCEHYCAVNHVLLLNISLLDLVMKHAMLIR